MFGRNHGVASMLAGLKPNRKYLLVPWVYANNRHFDITDELKAAIIAESNLLELSLLKKLINCMKKRPF